MIDAVLPLLAGVPGLAESARVRRGMEVLATTPRPPVGLTPHAIVHAQDKLVVRYYAPRGKARATPVVIVPSLINRAYICDLEPGRSLVASAGALLTRVLYVKPGHGKRFVVVDAGMNDLLRPSLYQAFHRIEPVRAREGDPITADIVGPVCESTDTFARDRELPPVEVGDLVVGIVSAEELANDLRIAPAEGGRKVGSRKGFVEASGQIQPGAEVQFGRVHQRTIHVPDHRSLHLRPLLLPGQNTLALYERRAFGQSGQVLELCPHWHPQNEIV